MTSYLTWKVWGKHNLISAFHVIEHLSDPRDILAKLADCLASGRRIGIEVHSSEDVVLTLYD